MKALENTHPENAHAKEEDKKHAIQSTPECSQTGNHNQIDLYGEVGELAKSLNGMVGKFQSAGSMMEGVSNQLPSGTDELLEVSRKTEEATQKILDDSDVVIDNHDLMSARLESLKESLSAEAFHGEINVKKDVEALCQLLEENKKTMFNLVGTLSFQDPAGQQLRKVTAMLKALQSRILKMVITFGKQSSDANVDENRQEELLSELEYSSDGARLEQNLVDTVLKEYGF